MHTHLIFLPLFLVILDVKVKVALRKLFKKKR